MEADCVPACVERRAHDTAVMRQWRSPSTPWWSPGRRNWRFPGRNDLSAYCGRLILESSARATYNPIEI